MVDFSKAYVIDDTTPPMAEVSPGHAKGLIPRDYSKHPVGFYSAAPPSEVALIPRDEWAERIRSKMEDKANLINIRRTEGPNGGHIPSLDQNGQGYCWYYSVTFCNMMVRAKMHQPYVRLSAHMGACIIKNYRDEGGWGALGLDFMEKHGVPSVEFWPEKSMSRSNDTPEMRKNALEHRVLESWADLQAAAYDRNLTEDQAITYLLTDDPVVGDFNHWGHSVALLMAVLREQAFHNFKTFAFPDFGSLDFNKEQDYKVFADIIGKRGVNSWTDNWGNVGEFDLFGTKAKLNGGVALRSVVPSVS